MMPAGSVVEVVKIMGGQKALECLSIPFNSADSIAGEQEWGQLSSRVGLEEVVSGATRWPLDTPWC